MCLPERISSVGGIVKSMAGDSKGPVAALVCSAASTRPIPPTGGSRCERRSISLVPVPPWEQREGSSGKARSLEPRSRALDSIDKAQFRTAAESNIDRMRLRLIGRGRFTSSQNCVASNARVYSATISERTNCGDVRRRVTPWSAAKRYQVCACEIGSPPRLPRHACRVWPWHQQRPWMPAPAET